MTMLVTASDGILDRLRTETRHKHDAIEAVLDIMTPDLSVAAYRKQLERFYGFYHPLEASIASLVDWSSVGLDLDVRRKSRLLVSDLEYLGINAADTLPMCLALPPLTSVAAGFGCLYVLEGATLGGQLISRHVKQTLSLDASEGTRFFFCYGTRTGMMWKAFRSLLLAFAVTPELEDEVVASAIATFDTLRCWCLPDRQLANHGPRTDCADTAKEGL
jgi:heme oxygenase